MALISRMWQKAALLALAAVALLLLQLPLHAQETSGRITGVVADATGAVIPGATVSLKDEQTGLARKTTSNEIGNFVFPAVLSSTSYQISVTVQGFRSWESQKFPLRPGDQIHFSDIRMQPGSEAAESVVVEAESESIKALDSGERSDVINAEEIKNLAIIGRDAGELVRTLPGVAMSSGSISNGSGYNSAVIGTSGPTSSFSANGTGTNGIAVVWDGVSLTDIGSNSGTVQNLNIDMVSEVKFSTDFGAEYAKGPAVENAIGLAGSPHFKGNLHFVARNNALNSNGWYNNSLRETRPDGSYYYPGGAIGGPVILPWIHFNHNHDKAFFFVGFEGYRQHWQAAELASWVPTMSERTGDFSADSLNAELCGARPDGDSNPNAILPMCYTQNYLPDGTILNPADLSSYANTSGESLVNWLPLPNANPFANSNGYNYIRNVMQDQNGTQLHIRLDYTPDDKNRFFAAWGRQSQITQNPVAMGWTPTASMAYPGGVTTGDLSNIFSFNYAHFFSASLTNEFTAAMSYLARPGNMDTPEKVDRFDLNKYNCSDATKRAAGTCGGSGGFNYLGMYKNGGDYSVPALTDYSSDGYPQMLMVGGFYNNKVRMTKAVPDLQDTLTWTHGRHTVKAGLYAEKAILNGLADNNAYPQGNFTFNPGTAYFMWKSAPSQSAQYIGCQNPDSAGNSRLSGAAYMGSCMNGVAMMYMGYADTYTQANFSPTVNMSYLTFSGFVTDSVKIGHVTLNGGMRIEHLGPWNDRHNNGIATFLPATYESVCSGRDCTVSGNPGVSWHSKDSAISNSVSSPSTVYYSPRVSAAWDVFGRGNTVLRGGWGVYRAEEEFNPYAMAAATAQGYKTSFLQGTLTFDKIDSYSPNSPPDFNAYTISASDKDRPVHYVYNVNVSQRMPWKSLLEVAYVGSDNVHLSSYNNGSYNSASDINIICGIVKGCPTNPNSENPDNNLFTVKLGDLTSTGLTDDGTGTDISSLTTAEQDFFRPYPFYQHIYQLNHKFYAHYNSMQVQWNKSSGRVNFNTNYTFSKNLAVAASYNNTIPDPVNLRNDYNPVSYDRTHVINVVYMIDLNKLLTRRTSGWLNDVANGWRVSGVSSWQSGFPMASAQGENFSFGYGQITATQVEHSNQMVASMESTCRTTYGIPADSNGNHYCVINMNPAVWLGTPDVLLMPTVSCNPAGGKLKHQFINPSCFGVPLPGENGRYRLPYIHGPAYMRHDISLMKDMKMPQDKTLNLKITGFNFLNHPLVSFDPNNTNNLNLQVYKATPGAALDSSLLLYSNFGVAGIKGGDTRMIELQMKYIF